MPKTSYDPFPPSLYIQSTPGRLHQICSVFLYIYTKYRWSCVNPRKLQSTVDPSISTSASLSPSASASASMSSTRASAWCAPLVGGTGVAWPGRVSGSAPVSMAGREAAVAVGRDVDIASIFCVSPLLVDVGCSSGSFCVSAVSSSSSSSSSDSTSSFCRGGALELEEAASRPLCTHLVAGRVIDPSPASAAVATVFVAGTS